MIWLVRRKKKVLVFFLNALPKFITSLLLIFSRKIQRFTIDFRLTRHTGVNRSIKRFPHTPSLLHVLRFVESEPKLSIPLTTALPPEIAFQVINPNGMVVDMWKPHVWVSGYKIQKEKQRCVFCSQLDSEGVGLRDISDNAHTYWGSASICWWFYEYYWHSENDTINICVGKSYVY